jgi:acetyl esterase/lipase
MNTVVRLANVLLLSLVVVSSADAQEDGINITPDVVYGHKDGMALTLDVYRPEKSSNGAGVLFIVSGGWYSVWLPPEQMRPIFKPLLERGFTVFAVRHGSSPRYVIPEIVEDVRRSVRFVRRNAERFGVDPQRLGVTGGSAGGHLSLILGTTSDDGSAAANDDVLRESDRVAAVVALYPPTDIRTWVSDPPENIKRFPALRFDPGKAADYSPLLHVTPDDPPTLLIHGDKDQLVPIDHSQKLKAALDQQQVPNELLVIEGGGHGFAGEDGRRATEALVDWFKKHLTSTAE